MPKQRPLDQRLSEAKDKVDDLELQKAIREMKVKAAIRRSKK